MKEEAKEKLSELLGFAKSHGLSEISWRENGLEISFRRQLKGKSKLVPSISSSSGAAGPVPFSNEEIIRSPIVGTFRRSVSKDRPPLVMDDMHIKPGDRLGIVECMKIPTDVVSFCQGVIKKSLVEEGHVVEYGQPLFIVTLQEPESNGMNGNGHV